MTRTPLLGRYDVRSRGADQASPSNQHLHSYGLICLPEMVELSTATGDAYYLDRTRKNLACFRQFLARTDGDFNAYKGMASERYYQTACFQSACCSRCRTRGASACCCCAARLHLTCRR